MTTQQRTGVASAIGALVSFALAMHGLGIVVPFCLGLAAALMAHLVADRP